MFNISSWLNLQKSSKLQFMSVTGRWTSRQLPIPKFGHFVNMPQNRFTVLLVFSFEIWSVQVEKTRLENSWRSFAVEKAYLEDIYYSGRPDFRETYYERSDILFWHYVRNTNFWMEQDHLFPCHPLSASIHE